MVDQYSPIKSKSAEFLDFCYHSKADLIALTETWSTDDDVAARLEINPSGYTPREQRRWICSPLQRKLDFENGH